MSRSGLASKKNTNVVCRMAPALRNRKFVKLSDVAPAEIKFLLELLADLKAAKYGSYDKSTKG